MNTHTYTLQTLELRLVQNNGHGWASIDILWEDVISRSPGGAYSWTVGRGHESGSGYGLWLNGQGIPDDTIGYADLTEWFEIEEDSGNEGSAELRR